MISLFVGAKILPPDPARAVDLNYALIGENATLYAYSGNGYFAVTTLPKTYFVVILGERDGYFRVSYLDIEGYVPANAVTAVDYTPKNKYAQNTALNLNNDGHQINFRSSPKAGDNVLQTLDSGTTLYYYGSVNGETQNENIGSLWYYARAYTPDGETLRGYVYSLYATAQPIVDNIIEPEDEKLNNELSSPPQAFNDNQTRETVIIVSLCLPVLAVGYLLFRKEKRL